MNTFDDTQVTRAILRSYMDKLDRAVESDVLLVGGGPANLVCAWLTAEAGLKTTLVERRLAPGGGMWGGGMLFSEVVVEPEAGRLLDNAGIIYKENGDGLLVADSVHATAALIQRATTAGASVLNAVTAEDLMVEEDRVTGLVVNWRPVSDAAMPVDPLTLRARAVVDGTGHDAMMCHVLSRRGFKLESASGSLAGEGPMSAMSGERLVIEKTGRIFPGLYVDGMAVAAVHGSPRMGPIFGGMLLSGERMARRVIDDLKAAEQG